MSNATKPQLLVTVFSDYICPFCYIGSVRLDRLRDRYDLKVNWALLEIHPETPAEGRPVADLGYSPEQLQEMMGELGEMAREEGITLIGRTSTTNSHKALLVSEAAKEDGPEAFYALHRRLFEAYFGEGQNIGDTEVLRKLAEEAGVSVATVERAWRDNRYEKRLKDNLMAALNMGVRSTPTYFIGGQKLVGALPTESLLEAARQVSS